MWKFSTYDINTHLDVYPLYCVCVVAKQQKKKENEDGKKNQVIENAWENVLNVIYAGKKPNFCSIC